MLQTLDHWFSYSCTDKEAGDGLRWKLKAVQRSIADAYYRTISTLVN